MAKEMAREMAREKDMGAVHEDILRWLKALRFRRRLIGGVDEADVLKKMEELNSLYEEALLAERARYEALLEKAGGERSQG